MDFFIDISPGLLWRFWASERSQWMERLVYWGWLAEMEIRGSGRISGSNIPNDYDLGN